MPAMIKCKCAVCGNGFSARAADVNRGWARSCSKSCAARAREDKRARRDARRPLKLAKDRWRCTDCGDITHNADGRCDHCAYMNEPQMGWDDHKNDA